MTKTIAFLFLTKGNLVHDNIWASYFKGKKNYTIYCHPSNKHVELYGILKGKKIKQHFETTWGHTALAHQALLAAAFANKKNYKFILCSESCVPIQSFDAMYKYLTLNNNSYIKQLHLAFDDRIKNEPLAQLLFIKKHAANYCLNRLHTMTIVNAATDMMCMFQRMPNGDEHFLSLIWELEYEESIENSWIVYSNWDYTKKKIVLYRKMVEKEYKIYKELKKKKQKEKAKKQKRKVGKQWSFIRNFAAHPKTYNQITAKTFGKLHKFFFARKFEPSSNIGKFVGHG